MLATEDCANGKNSPEFLDSFETLTLAYAAYVATSTTGENHAVKDSSGDCQTSSSTSEEVVCNLHDFLINSECHIVFIVNSEGQSVVGACTEYTSSHSSDAGPTTGDILVGVDGVAVVDSYYAESLLDSKDREVISMRFYRGPQGAAEDAHVPLAGAPIRESTKENKRASKRVVSSGRDLEYFRREFEVLAHQAFDKGCYKWALQSAYKVLKICNAMENDTLNTLRCHDLIGRIHERLGIFLKSLSHFELALSLAQKCELGVLDIIHLRERMGHVCRQLKQYENSINHYTIAAQLLQERLALMPIGTSAVAPVEEKESLISVYSALGKVYRQQGDHLDRALECEIQALNHLRSLGYSKGSRFNESDKVLARVNICLILGLQGDLSIENETEMIMAVKTLERGSFANIIRAASIYRSVSNFYELRKDWERAIMYRFQEIKIRKSFANISATLASALWRMAVYYRQCHDEMRSSDYRRETIDVMTSLYGPESKKKEKYVLLHQRYSEVAVDRDKIDSQLSEQDFIKSELSSFSITCEKSDEETA